MVLLEFKICPSCCSYFLSHTRGREAILDSDTPMSPPTTIGQQGPALQADTMQIPLGRSQVHLTDSETNERAPEDNSTGRRTSGRVRKRTQVDGRCECDVEITADEEEELTVTVSHRMHGLSIRAS